MDLKKLGAAEVILQLIEKSDALIEGFRPGVMERLGLSPDICLQRNIRSDDRRGTDGPLAHAAGHDLNYISISGVAYAMGYWDRPPNPPLHLVGDPAGGAMMLAFGMLSALFETGRSGQGQIISGQGQIIDAAISDGVAYLSTMYHCMRDKGTWNDHRSDIWLTVARPAAPNLWHRRSRVCQPDGQSALAQAEGEVHPTFRSKTRDQWCALLEGTDACFAPVLGWAEATRYPHNVARKVFVEIDGLV